MQVKRFDDIGNGKEQFMMRAIELAIANIENGGGPFGCVVVKNGEVVGEGVNRVTYNNDPTAHAEVMAIRDACKNLNDFQLNGCEIYTSCEPCPMCFGAIYWARPAKLYYGANKVDAAKANFDDYFIYKEIDKQPGQRSIPMEQLLGDRAKEVFDMWLGIDKKIQY